MLIGFITVIMSGHIYCLMFLVVINVGIYNEIISIKRRKDKDLMIPFSNALNWYFLFVSIYYLYGKIIGSKLS